MTHEVETLWVPPHLVSAMGAIDHSDEPLGSLSLDELQSGNDGPAKEALREALTLQGQSRPVLAVQRDGRTRMVDGHHRALIALEHGWDLLTELHTCACDSASLDYFGLCPLVCERVVTIHHR